MPEYVAKYRLYHTADKSRVVEEGDPEAAFLAVGEGRVLSEAEAEALGVLDHLEKVGKHDALKAEEAALKAAEERGAVVEAQSRRMAVERLKADPPKPGADMAVYGGFAGAKPEDAAPVAPTPDASQPDAGSSVETIRLGSPQKSKAAPDAEAKAEADARDVPAGEGLKAEPKGDAPAEKADAAKSRSARSGAKG